MTQQSEYAVEKYKSHRTQVDAGLKPWFTQLRSAALLFFFFVDVMSVEGPGCFPPKRIVGIMVASPTELNQSLSKRVDGFGTRIT